MIAGKDFGNWPKTNFAIDDDSFYRISRLILSESGIVLHAGKRGLVVSRLSRRLRALGLVDFKDYCEIIERQNGYQERREMLFLLTTNVTRFFREPHHFDQLDEYLRSWLHEDTPHRRSLRIWSAGCSSGEEPYSIAMKVLDVLPNIHEFDVRILGTDIDAVVLKEAINAVYPPTAVKDVPMKFLEKYFEGNIKGDGGFRLTSNVRSLVKFGELNLLQPWPMSGSFDLVFCRNVVIYFDASTQISLWKRFSKILKTSGILSIGHSERIAGSAVDDFSSCGITQYRKVAN